MAPPGSPRHPQGEGGWGGGLLCGGRGGGWRRRRWRWRLWCGCRGRVWRRWPRRAAPQASGRAADELAQRPAAAPAGPAAPVPRQAAPPPGAPSEAADTAPLGVESSAPAAAAGNAGAARRLPRRVVRVVAYRPARLLMRGAPHLPAQRPIRAAARRRLPALRPRRLLRRPIRRRPPVTANQAPAPTPPAVSANQGARGPQRCGAQAAGAGHGTIRAGPARHPAAWPVRGLLAARVAPAPATAVANRRRSNRRRPVAYRAPRTPLAGPPDVHRRPAGRASFIELRVRWHLGNGSPGAESADSISAAEARVGFKALEPPIKLLVPSILGAPDMICVATTGLGR